METTKIVRDFMFLAVAVVFFLGPLFWIDKSTGIGCTYWLTANEFDYLWCHIRGLIGGLTFWPFRDMWTDVGMQMIMISYAIFGIGIALILIIKKTITIKTKKLE